MTRDELLENLMISDFVATDLALYLNTHPTDQLALQKYNETILVSDELREQYTMKYGPLCASRSYAHSGWKWENEPWPWQYDFHNDAIYRKEL
jgi:spore coat protein JB